MSMTPQRHRLARNDRPKVNSEERQYLLGIVEFSIAEQQFETESENCRDTVGGWDTGDFIDRVSIPNPKLNNREIDCEFKR